MKCLYPQQKLITTRNTVFPIEHRCGQCKACLITKRESVGARILLESMMFINKAAFITLTYNEKNRPETGSLIKNDVRLFLQQLRRQSKCDLSSVVVGEYGDANGNAHYHLAVFGIPILIGYSEQMPKYKKLYEQVCRKRHYVAVDFPGYEQLCLRAWKYKGHVNVGLIESASAKYIGGYATKKLTSTKETPEGCIPEYVSWSRKRAPGKVAAQHIADLLLNAKCYPKEHPNMAQGPDWIPVKWESMACVEGKSLVLDRYMKNKVIEYMGGDARTDDQKRVRAFAQSVMQRQRPITNRANRGRPIIDIRLSEQEKARAKAHLRLSRIRRHQKQKYLHSQRKKA